MTTALSIPSSACSGATATHRETRGAVSPHSSRHSDKTLGQLREQALTEVDALWAIIGDGAPICDLFIDLDTEFSDYDAFRPAIIRGVRVELRDDVLSALDSRGRAVCPGLYCYRIDQPEPPEDPRAHTVTGFCHQATGMLPVVWALSPSELGGTEGRDSFWRLTWLSKSSGRHALYFDQEDEARRFNERELLGHGTVEQASHVKRCPDCLRVYEGDGCPFCAVTTTINGAGTTCPERRNDG